MTSLLIGNVLGKEVTETEKKARRRISTVITTLAIFIINWKRSHESSKRSHRSMKVI